MTQEELQALEELIDANTLNAVIEALGEICHEKAEHIRTNWQDKVTARPWDIMGRKLHTISAKCDI